ncbi:hypothetical protein L7F22_062950 [Adiantum nelumboides]|nr:hypothetical protein [Adiantum nelumboides]
MLMQKDHETSYMHSIYFSSRMMTGPEKGYTPVEHIVLALMFATQKFRPYFLPMKLVILTMEEVFPYVLQHMDVSSRISKWLIRLQELEYTVQVESSTQASLAGILTHRHFEKKVKPQGEEVLPLPEPVKLEEAHSLYFDGTYKRTIDKAVVAGMVKDHETSYMHSIYFSSRMMTGPEKGYTPVEHIVLALMFATQKFRPYFLPMKLVILTMEEVFPYVLQHMDVSSRISKWLIRLQELEYTVQVESSTQASLAGILTHRHFEKKVKPQGEEVLPLPEPVKLEEAHSLYFDGTYKRTIDKAVVAGMVGEGADCTCCSPANPNFDSSCFVVLKFPAQEEILEISSIEFATSAVVDSHIGVRQQQLGERTHIDWAVWEAGPAASYGIWCRERLLPVDILAEHYRIGRVRWPNFLCVCSVSLSGYVRLHWCQWPPVASTLKTNWFATKRAVLGVGRSDLMSADAIVSEAGTLLIAGVPIGNSSSVVVWEVAPISTNSQGNPQVVSGFASWPGTSPLPAFLLSWHEKSAENDMKAVTESAIHLPGVEVKPQTSLTNMRSQEPPASSDETGAPLLQCSVVSYLSACAENDISTRVGWGSGVSAVSFDPSKGGSVLIVLLNEGRHSLPFPDEGPAFNEYRVQRWESSRQQVGVHPLFESVAYSSTSPSTSTTIWRPTTDKSISINKKGEFSFLESARSCDEPLENLSVDQPTTIKTCSKIVFSAHGGELAVVTAGEGVHIYSGSNLDLTDSYYLNVGITCAAPCFSPTGCCLSTVWHDTSKDCSVLKILRAYPPPLPAMQGANISSTWERGLADRYAVISTLVESSLSF